MSDSRARKESARSADFRTKLGQSGATTSVTISWCLGVKPAAAKLELISSLDGKSASSMARTGTDVDINRARLVALLATQPSRLLVHCHLWSIALAKAAE